MTDGVMYMTWGENAISQAENSMRSLWHHDKNMPVMVVGDETAQAHFEGSKVQFQLITIDPFNQEGPQGYKFMAGRIKPLLAGISHLTGLSMLMLIPISNKPQRMGSSCWIAGIWRWQKHKRAAL